MTVSILVAQDLCRKLENIAPKYGAHIALTGGCLYKYGERKDIDIIVYRIRQVECVDVVGFLRACYKELDLRPTKFFGTWLVKAMWKGYDIDLMFPEGKGNVNEKSFPEGTCLQSPAVESLSRYGPEEADTD